MTNETPVSMRLTGHQKPFRLTPSAHRELLSYLANARDELADDPDGDETVRDLEASIGDQLSALGDNPVDAGQMRSTLNQVGPVVSEPGTPDPTGIEEVLLQSWGESSEDSVSHSLMAAACGRSQAVSKTRLTITASGFGCP